MQQHRRRSVGDAGIAVSRAGGDALEKREHATHLGDHVQCGYEVHLGGARVGEAHVDAAVDQGLDQSLRAVHGRTFRSSEKTRSALPCRKSLQASSLRPSSSRPANACVCAIIG